jgi:hypothetical protein
MMPERTPDAVRSLLPYAGAGGSHARLAKLHAEFAPILKAPQIFVRHQGADHFVSARPDDTLNFPSLSARSGAPRYHWEDRGDGVLYGYLRQDD